MLRSHARQVRHLLGATVMVWLAFATAPAYGEEIGKQPLPLPDLHSAPTSLERATWKDAAAVSLDIDFISRRTATEKTSAYVGQDAGFIDVLFVVNQREPIVASQVTNGSGVTSDDYVAVEFAPQGTTGFAYAFYANALGARYQTSSENSAYTPEWSAIGKRTSTGYSVQMRIPISVMRSGGSHAWRVQLVRYTQALNELAVWAYSPAAGQVADATFFGAFDHVGSADNPSRPQARIQPYVVSQSGATNRANAGVDVSIPITPTASFLTSLYPDYSNVEVDQQSISPSAFPRQYREVRPFFTQLGSSFNNWFSCGNCPVPLYTPIIPKFSQGYAVEGNQGPYGFAAYDARGDQRLDQAQTFTYGVSDTSRAELLSVQRVAVTTPNVVDTTTTVNAGYLNQKSHYGLYTNLGQDRGTYVTQAKTGNYAEAGAFYAGTSTQYGLTYQKIGAQFSPLDGYVQQTDVNGYEAYGRKLIKYKPSSAVQDVFLLDAYSRQWNSAGQLSLVTNYAQLNLGLKKSLTFEISLNHQGILTSGGELLPFDSNGVLLGYRLGKNQANGSSSTTATPSFVQYSGGAYYHGSLISWVYHSTIPVSKRLFLALEADENRYSSRIASEDGLTQWLERASLDWQISRNARFDVGLRRIVGSNLPNAYQQVVPASSADCAANEYNAGCFVQAGNLSLAFHWLSKNHEIFASYGDPNVLRTRSKIVLKWIRYFGASKGT